MNQLSAHMDHVMIQKTRAVVIKEKAYDLFQTQTFRALATGPGLQTINRAELHTFVTAVESIALIDSTVRIGRIGFCTDSQYVMNANEQIQNQTIHHCPHRKHTRICCRAKCSRGIPCAFTCFYAFKVKSHWQVSEVMSEADSCHIRGNAFADAAVQTSSQTYQSSIKCVKKFVITTVRQHLFSLKSCNIL